MAVLQAVVARGLLEYSIATLHVLSRIPRVLSSQHTVVTRDHLLLDVVVTRMIDATSVHLDAEEYGRSTAHVVGRAPLVGGMALLGGAMEHIAPALTLHLVRAPRRVYYIVMHLVPREVDAGLILPRSSFRRALARPPGVTHAHLQGDTLVRPRGVIFARVLGVDRVHQSPVVHALPPPDVTPGLLHLGVTPDLQQ